MGIVGGKLLSGRINFCSFQFYTIIYSTVISFSQIVYYISHPLLKEAATLKDEYSFSILTTKVSHAKLLLYVVTIVL